MASIYARDGRFYVISTVYDDSGKRHQKWETFPTLPQANKRKLEIEHNEKIGTLVVPHCGTVSELLSEYVQLYGKVKWSPSVYQSNTSLIRHYVQPHLGNILLTDISAHTLEKYYQMLLKTPSVSNGKKKKKSASGGFVTPATIRKIHSLLRSAFTQGEKWDMIEKNPARLATVPKHVAKKREIWDASTLFLAIESCKDERLKLCMNLAFAASLRIGELLGLTWDCVDVSEESIMAGTCSVSITKELQRVKREAIEALEGRDIIAIFPDQSPGSKSVVVLKKPKTISSIRKVFLPKTVAKMLVAWKMEQDATREALGNTYNDFNLVIATPYGMPTDSSVIRKAMKELIKENDLPPVVFHSLRHSSITYKLKLNGGDIKAVQGDSGHSQASMVTDQYSHILDENRRTNAQLFENEFYAGQDAGSEAAGGNGAGAASMDRIKAAGIDPIQLIKILKNPDMVKMLQILSNTMQA